MNKKLYTFVPNVQPDSVPLFEGDGMRRWRSFKNAFTTVRLLQSPRIKRLNSPDDLTLSGARNSGKVMEKSASSRELNEALKMIQIQQLLFMLIERGATVASIQEVLNKDPKKYFHGRLSPFSLVNKKNPKGITPLYLAAQLGHVEICQVLLENGADPKIAVSINGIDDTPVEAALRWKHLNVVNLLQKNS